MTRISGVEGRVDGEEIEASLGVGSGATADRSASRRVDTDRVGLATLEAQCSHRDGHLLALVDRLIDFTDCSKLSCGSQGRDVGFAQKGASDEVGALLTADEGDGVQGHVSDGGNLQEDTVEVTSRETSACVKVDASNRARGTADTEELVDLVLETLDHVELGVTENTTELSGSEEIEIDTGESAAEVVHDDHDEGGITVDEVETFAVGLGEGVGEERAEEVVALDVRHFEFDLLTADVELEAVGRVAADHFDTFANLVECALTFTELGLSGLELLELLAHDLLNDVH